MVQSSRSQTALITFSRSWFKVQGHRQHLFYDADNRWRRNACPTWYFTDCAVSSGLFLLTQNRIVYLVSVFICAGTSRSVAALTSVHCACVCELLEQPVNATFVHSLPGNSVLNCLTLYPFNWYNFLSEPYLHCCLQTMQWHMTSGMT